ncbi:hypothetical protein C8R47DRAFT_1074815 [Mycena vitilis]|nr:hypothetical protein C8R47DRAFT_1074815 [Mycena vitilis]
MVFYPCAVILNKFRGEEALGGLVLGGLRDQRAQEGRTAGGFNLFSKTSRRLSAVTRGLQMVLARDTVPAPVAPAYVPVPALTTPTLLPHVTVPATPAAPPGLPAVVQAHPPAPPAPALPVAVDMQAAFTAAFQTVLANNRRGREDDDVDDRRNVRHRADATPFIAPSIPDAPSAAPNAPDAPSRRNDPARELVFGPVNWKTNINSECRTIIAEGMTSRPNMRGVVHLPKRQSTSAHPILVIGAGFETAAYEGITDNAGTEEAEEGQIKRPARKLARTGLVTTRPGTAPAAARGGAGANPFGGTGGQGNLFAAPEMTDAAKTYLRGIVTKLTGSMLQDDAAGRNEYARRIASFNAVHGTNKIWLERTGYPLSPGTSPPCTKECYVCGKVTIPWHRRADCPGPPIPRREATFRSLCAKYLEERAVAVNAVLGDLDWMDFVTQDAEEEDFGEGLAGSEELPGCHTVQNTDVVFNKQFGDAKATLENQHGVPRPRKPRLARVAGAPAAFKGVFLSAKPPVGHVPPKIIAEQNVSDTDQVADDADCEVVGESADGKKSEEQLDTRLQQPRTRTNSLGACAAPVREVLNVTVEGDGLETDKSLADGVVQEEELPKVVRPRLEEPCKRTNSVGACAAPVREVPDVVSEEPQMGTDETVSAATVQSTRWAEEERGEIEETDRTLSTHAISTGAGATPVRGVLAEAPIAVGNVMTDHVASDAFDTELYDMDAYAPVAAASIYTRATDPFNPARVAEVLRLVQLGPDLTDTEQTEVRAFVASYADIFALAVSEVFPVKDAVYAPHIPKDQKFSTKVHQRPVTQPQGEYLHQQVDMMEKAGIIRPIHPRDVKLHSRGSAARV